MHSSYDALSVAFDERYSGAEELLVSTIGSQTARGVIARFKKEEEERESMAENEIARRRAQEDQIETQTSQ